jgi:hypothetical protein
MAREAPVAPE